MAELLPRGDGSDYEVVGDLSSSRWRRYDECPRAYLCEYVEKRNRPLPEWAGAGLLVHATMERIGKAQLALPPAARRAPSVADLLAMLNDVAATHGAARGPTGAQRVEDAREALAESAYRLDWRDAIEVEGRHTFAIGGRQASVKWDRADMHDGFAVEIVDWKTGEDVLSRREAAHDVQVGLYLVAARDKWPDARSIAFTLDYLSRDLRVTVEWTPELDASVRRRAQAHLDRVANECEWPARVNPYCGSCPWRNDCPAYRDLVPLNGATGGAEMTLANRPASLLALSNDDLVRLRQRLATVAKVAEAARLECDEHLQARLDHMPRLTAGGCEVRVVSRSRSEMAPLEEVAVVVSKHVPDTGAHDNLLDPADVARRIASADKGKLDALLRELPEATAKAIRAELKERRVVKDGSCVECKPVEEAF